MTPNEMNTDPVKQVQKIGNTTIVSLTGEIDLYSSPLVGRTLTQVAADRTPTLAVDLSEVPYMDSSGVATIVAALQKVKKYNGRLVLAGMSDRVRSVFEIARLTQLFDICGDVREILDHA
jgi:anti-sigma B factor antagonist